MSVRRELFTAIKDRLVGIDFDNTKAFELVDLQKGQLQDGKEYYGSIYTAALITIGDIQWQNMTRRNQEGECTITVDIHTKEGYTDQLNTTPDPQHGIASITLIDLVVEFLDGFKGACFKPLDLTRETQIQSQQQGEFIYRIEFNTWVYRSLNKKYVS